jgi:uncharacterized protein (DUF2252 family)
MVVCYSALVGCSQSEPPRSVERAQVEPRWLSWRPRMNAGRRKLVLTHLERRANGMSPETRKLHDERLRESPLSFYRATASLFLRDIRSDEFLAQSFFYRRDSVTWISGDAHVANVGAFEDDRGKLAIDLNDFDEAWIASPLHDVWRMAASIALLARENALGRRAERIAITAFAVAYAEEILGDVSSSTSGISDALPEDARARMLEKWAPLEDGKRRFTRKKLRPLEGDERFAIVSAIETLYPASLEGKLKDRTDYFKVIDVARRIDAGVGSLGADRYWVLVRGPSNEPMDDRILEVKAQRPPALAELAPRTTIPNMSSGCRVALAQRVMLEAASDHAGCFEALGQSFSVRERSPFKEDDAKLEHVDTEPRLQSLARLLGLRLARAHVRGGAHVKGEEHPAFAPAFKRILREPTLGTSTTRKVIFVEETIAVGIGYADQVELDFAMHRSAT